MYIARWQFTTRFGKTDDCLAVLRKWEVDVGPRVGWRPSSIRILTGFIGASQQDVEFESHFDNLGDFESALGDMDRVPYHREYLKQLEQLIVPGTNRWSIYKDNPLER